MRNHSYENDFDLHENETACRTHFLLIGFALRIVLKQRHNRTRKTPIRSVIVRVITTLDDREAGVRFLYHREYDYRPNWTTRSLITIYS